MSEFFTALAAQVREENGFWNDYRWLSEQNASRYFQSVTEEFFQKDEIKRLLRCATIFSKSQEDTFRNEAQDIAYAILAMSPPDSVFSICSHVLASVGNFPAYTFITGRDRAEQPKGFLGEGSVGPLPLLFEELGRKSYNTVQMGEKEVTLTDFQYQLWETLETNDSVGVSAPTSAGKSFILQQYLRQLFANPEIRSVAYLAPSRALIAEVQANMTRALSSLGEQVRITSVPIVLEGEGIPEKNLFVVTQERLQVLLSNSADVQFDIVIVDEAQQIAEGARGIILQNCLEEVRRRSPNAQLMFLTPGAKNPDTFQRLFEMPNFSTISSTLRPVRQNLVFVDFDNEHPNDLLLSIGFNGKPHLVGRFSTQTNFTEASKRLSSVALELGKEGQSLVYCGGAADAERTALLLSGALPEVQNDKLIELSKFIRDHIHPDYALAETVKSGVAFHYGVMPTVLRQAIEEQFSDGSIKYLPCTSTLLQGVNLPARNVFMMKPERGNNIPMDSEGFWNLAGRAGRLGKDIEGNVFLISYDSWEKKPWEGERGYEIEAALSLQLSKRRDELLAFVEDRNHPSGQERAFEGAINKLYLDHKAGNFDLTIQRLGLDIGIDEKLKISSVVAAVGEYVTLPDEIIAKSATVSPFRQQDLYRYFEDKIAKGDVSGIIPVHPAAEWGDAYDSLARVFRRIHFYLEKKKSRDRSQYFFAPFALRWMRGDSLPILIQDRIDYLKSKGKIPRTATQIREVLEDVEKDLRFRYVEYCSCYIALLTHALQMHNMEDRIQTIPALPLYLELGACTGTMVSLIELGVSRISAKEFSKFIQEFNANTADVKTWFKRTNAHALGISPVVIAEAQRLGLIA